MRRSASPRCQTHDGIGDGIPIDPKMPVEIAYRSRLAEMLDAVWDRPVTRHRAQPGERRRMAIYDGNHGTMSGQWIE